MSCKKLSNICHQGVLAFLAGSKLEVRWSLVRWKSLGFGQFVRILGFAKKFWSPFVVKKVFLHWQPAANYEWVEAGLRLSAVLAPFTPFPATRTYFCTPAVYNICIDNDFSFGAPALISHFQNPNLFWLKWEYELAPNFHPNYHNLLKNLLSPRHDICQMFYTRTVSKILKYLIIFQQLGTPFRTKSSVFLNIVQTGGGVKPMFKNFVANLV